MNISERISAFARFGQFLSAFSRESDVAQGEEYGSLNERIKTSHLYNAWYIEDSVRAAISAISKSIKEDNISKWIDLYKGRFNTVIPKTIAVVMAGNIPLVGFHDFFCVLMSGNKFLGKLSSQDKHLLPAVADILISFEPRFKEYIAFTEGRLEKFDAVIATGSNNTSRYFEYYFGKYPNIIRKNRNSVAVLNGKETENDLKKLGNDIFLYFGLGCRNVSKLFVPRNYDFGKFFKAIESYNDVANNHKYFNNYEYNKAVYLVNKIKHLDNNFLLLKEDKTMHSPVSVVYYEYFSDRAEVETKLKHDSVKIQCVVTNDKGFDNCVPFGKSQFPALWDYADGVDTIRFLCSL